MDLDLDLAVKQKSDNPVYYLQYAHARMASIFEKAAAKGIHFDASLDHFETLNMTVLNPLLNLLSEYPLVIEKAAITKEIHKLPLYLHKLSSAFHKWYAEEKILTEDLLHVKERLYVLKAIQTLLKDGLETIGVEAKTVM
jgi:arginyl-tRNA synthetase